MQDHNILDAPQEDELKQQLKDQNVKYLRISGVLLLVNIVTPFLIIDLDSEVVIWVIYYIAYGLISGVGFLGFLIGLAFAGIPYKGLDYNKRYVRASFLCVIGIYCLLIVGWLIYGVLQLAGIA